MWRSRFVVVYAAANAAAVAISGAAVCGLHLQWFVSIAVLAFAMATLQTLVLAFCANIGIGPAWIESPIGWALAGATGQQPYTRRNATWIPRVLQPNYSPNATRRSHHPFPVGV